jgi:uncharacterized membrane protein
VPRLKEAVAVQVSLPLVLLLGAFVLFLVRKAGLKVFHALIATLLGFYLSETFLAARIGQFNMMVADLFGTLHSPR